MTTDELAGIIEDLRAFATDLQHVEAKAAHRGFPRRLWETLSAFSNTPGGGILILGLEEAADFRPVGVHEPRKAMQDLASLCDQMVPPVRALIDLHQVEGSTLLVVEVPEVSLGDKPCYYSGAGLTNGAFVRVADGDRRLTEYEVQIMRASRGQPRDDLELVEGTSVGDLDDELVQRFIEIVRTTRPTLGGRTAEEILRTSGVLVDTGEEQGLSLAGLLALGREPQRFFPELSVTFVSYPGTRIGDVGPLGERFLDEGRIEGPIPSMIAPAMAMLQRNMKRRAVVQGIGRESQWEYPITALREGLVNALVHRDLSSLARGTPVQIQLFPDRLTIINPGGLHGPVTLETLGDAGVSSSRNATLMRILEDTPGSRQGRMVCENRGSGIGAMLAALRESGMSPPEFDDRIATFSVTFPNHTLFDQDTLVWLAGIGAGDFTDNQRVGLALLRNGQTLSNEVYRKFNHIDSRLATRELRELVNRGLIRPVSSGRWTTYQLLSSVAEQGTLDIEDPAAPKPAEMGHPTAQAIVALLADGGELSKSAIASALEQSPSTILYWLKKLRSAGVVEPTAENIRSPYNAYRIVGSG